MCLTMRRSVDMRDLFALLPALLIKNIRLVFLRDFQNEELFRSTSMSTPNNPHNDGVFHALKLNYDVCVFRGE